MAIDSSAELLFNIGANTDDAESNILRFRTLMGKDLSDLTGEFDAWAGKLVGDLGTVKGALIATSALMGRGWWRRRGWPWRRRGSTASMWTRCPRDRG